VLLEFRIDDILVFRPARLRPLPGARGSACRTGLLAGSRGDHVQGLVQISGQLLIAFFAEALILHGLARLIDQALAARFFVRRHFVSNKTVTIAGLTSISTTATAKF